ncbi:MAG: ABC-2 family transporter protein, partial [Lachnospiraceae bacterium]|nr:ABC-2 family transporter protein [Lachnospiraceae bacterium]
FEGISRFLLYFIIPVGMAVWLPLHVIVNFDVRTFFALIGYACLLSGAAVAVFYRGLRRYASGNLMEARL